jgi:nicotinamide mononucleotide transporter
MSWLEIVAAVASAVGVWLTTKRLLVAWPVTILACVLYAEVFRENSLYSDMLLQAIFTVCAVYGWWHWLRGVRADGIVRVEALGWRGWLLGIAVGAAGSIVLGFLMGRYTGASLPWLDSALTVFSLVGTWWGAQKYIANWWLWIVVDVIYVGEYIYKHLNLTAGLYAFFILLAALGLRDWRRALDAQNARDMGEVEAV